MIRAGVGPEQPVALLVERSWEMLVAMLGIWKAGGAYLPLDPDYPPQRLEFMLADSRPAALVTQAKFADRCANATCLTLRLDADGDQLAGESRANPGGRAAPRQLAYLIYTSGSTGLPKGVAIEHRGLVNLATWYQAEYGVSAADRFSQLGTLAFDASVLEIWFGADRRSQRARGAGRVAFCAAGSSGSGWRRPRLRIASCPRRWRRRRWRSRCRRAWHSAC